jgi:hypothetical protein
MLEFSPTVVNTTDACIAWLAMCVIHFSRTALHHFGTLAALGINNDTACIELIMYPMHTVGLKPMRRGKRSG